MGESLGRQIIEGAVVAGAFEAAEDGRVEEAVGAARQLERQAKEFEEWW